MSPMYESWVRVKCICGTVIGGYPYGSQPQYLEIHHQCNPDSDAYQVTMMRR